MLRLVLRQEPPIFGIEFPVWIPSIPIGYLLQICLQVRQFRLEIEKVLVVEFAELSENGEIVVVAHHRRNFGVAFVSHYVWA